MGYEGPREPGETLTLEKEVDGVPNEEEEEEPPKVKKYKEIELLGERSASGDLKGTAIFPQGDKYVGGYLKGLRHGNGTYTYASGPPPPEGEEPEEPIKPKGEFEGVWKKGVKSGLGVMTYADGSKYQGMWKAGKRNGQGAFFYANGDIYTGEWEAGYKHGQGTYFCKASGATLVGKYVKGNLTHGSFSDMFGQTYTGAFAGAASSVSYAGGDWTLASGATQSSAVPDWLSTFDGDAKARPSSLTPSARTAALPCWASLAASLNSLLIRRGQSLTK